MIRKVTFCMAMLCFMVSAYAQSGGGTTSQNSINTIKLTDVLSPAPNASELTRYAGLPVNMATGSVSANIPLGQVSAGRVKMPISLAYNSSNGVSINSPASRTGMSWILNAGGVISRSVQGKPDESSQWIDYPTNPSAADSLLDYLTKISNNTTYDSQVDIFNFNFNGYSGKFYLDPHSSGRKSAIFLESSSLKVETNLDNTLPGNWTIKVTDPTGTIYYFGGTGATETSKTSPNGAGCGKNYDTPIATAWYLKAVQHYTGEYIWLEYLPVTFDYFTSVSQTLIRTPAGGAGWDVCATKACPIRTEDQVCFSRLVSSGVILKAINSRYQRVTFQYSERQDILGDSLLTNVKFYSKSLLDSAIQTQYNNYSLAYTTANNTSYYNASGGALTYRPFLTSVTRTAGGMPSEIHKMNYYNINGLASRLSFAQDYWGYFNGRNNSNLIPISSDPAISAQFPTNLSSVNRNPNGAFGYFGLLSKIVYPTVGYDSIVYEPNTVYDTRVISAGPVYVTKTATGTGSNGEVNVLYNFQSGQDQNINLDMSCYYSGSGINDSLHQNLIVSVISPSGYEIYNQVLKIGQSWNTSSVQIGSGSYTLKLSAHGEAALGTVTMRYIPQGTTETKNFEVGGVRVAKTISTPLNGAVLTKRYVYASLTSQTQSSGKIRLTPNALEYYGSMVDGGSCQDGACHYLIGYSNSIHSLNLFAGSHIYYTNVIELNGSDWKNGGVEHKYAFVASGANAQVILNNEIPAAPMNTDYLPVGLEILNQVFKTTGGVEGNYTFKTLKTVDTHYKTDKRLESTIGNYVVKKNWNPGVYPPGTFDHFDVTRTDYTTKWVYADTVITTTYDINGNSPFVNSSYTVYNNLSNLLPTEQHTIDSYNTDQKMVTKYPKEMVSAGITSPYQAMINKNIIATPVEQSLYSGATLTQYRKTSYKDFGNQVYEPDSIITKTNNGLNEKRLYISAYNSSGNVLSQQLANGPVNSYLWGYNNLYPVLQARNAASNQVFYEGFENAGNAPTTRAHLGLRSSNGNSYPVNFTKPGAGIYIISWYQWNNVKWEYKSETYAGNKTFAIGTIVDDICIYPIEAAVTLQAYEPYKGISSAVDERGETTVFQYDGYQRLRNIRDLDSNIVKNFEYHFNTSNPTVYLNVEKSQTFTKNCSTGYGNDITYKVPAGTYSSTSSQADADNQALADIAVNGQQYADSQGACTTSVGIFYYNQTPQSGGNPTGRITNIKFKDASGNVIYNFTETQLNAGQTINAGIYNVEITTSGGIWTPGTGHTGWAVIELANAPYNTIYHIDNTGATTYTINNAAMTSGSPWALYIEERVLHHYNDLIQP